MYSINMDGTNLNKISDDTSIYMVVKDGWIYYDNKSDEGRLYKMRVDGSEKSKMDDNACFFLTVYDDWAYYTDGHFNTSMNRINVRTLEKQEVIHGGVYNNINIANNSIFFGNGSDMYYKSLEGGEVKEMLLDKSLFGDSNDMEVLIKGSKLNISADEPQPQMINDRVMVPLRAIAEQLHSYGMQSTEGLSLIILKDEKGLAMFNDLSEEDKSQYISNLVYDNYALVVGCNPVHAKVIFDGKIYYEGEFDYDKKDDMMKLRYYTNGKPANVVKQYKSSFNYKDFYLLPPDEQVTSEIGD